MPAPAGGDRGGRGRRARGAQQGQGPFQLITLLVAPAELAGDAIEVAGQVYRHLFRARRLAVGARLRLVDGAGNARWAEVVRVGSDRAVLRAGAAAPANEPEYRLYLVVAALRPARASWLVEKATEIGVGGVRFVASERTPRSYGAARLERLDRVARAAVEQCHRARLPAVSGVHGWSEMPDLLAPAADRWYLDPGAGERSADPGGGDCGAVVVGPEGGFSAAEQEELERLGCAPVGLGPRVLRVETSAVVAAARILLAGW